MFVVDYGLLQINKFNIENDIKFIIEDSIENDYNDEIIQNLINKNINNTSVNITNSLNELVIEVNYTFDGIMFNKNKTINIKYIGNKNTKEIEKG